MLIGYDSYKEIKKLPGSSWDYENLAGGLEHELHVPFHIWDVILPIDFIFF